jgi:hypothetical protein
VQETKKEAGKVFAGIKRLLGIEEIFDTNETMINGKTPRPKYEREDGTIDKEKQEEALKELTLQRRLKESKIKTMPNF